MTASRYLPSAKYLWPLSKYFCLRTLGSREQPVSSAARQPSVISAGTREERFITKSPRGALCLMLRSCQPIKVLHQEITRKLLASSWRHRAFRTVKIISGGHSCSPQE